MFTVFEVILLLTAVNCFCDLVNKLPLCCFFVNNFELFWIHLKSNCFDTEWLLDPCQWWQWLRVHKRMCRVTSVTLYEPESERQWSINGKQRHLLVIRPYWVMFHFSHQYPWTSTKTLVWLYDLVILILVQAFPSFWVCFSVKLCSKLLDRAYNGHSCTGKVLAWGYRILKMSKCFALISAFKISDAISEQ